jgi:hypothetical protein
MATIKDIAAFRGLTRHKAKNSTTQLSGFVVPGEYRRFGADIAGSTVNEMAVRRRFV